MMHVSVMPALLALGLVLGAGRAGAAAEDTPDGEEGSGFFGGWVAKHLSVGVRVTRFRLEDTRRATDHGYDNSNLKGNFLGSLWGLDAEQHYFPNPFLEYRIFSVFGVGVAYDQVRARTLDWANDEQTATAGDGDLEIRGLQYYIFGRYPNRTRLTPHADLGLTRYGSRFFETAEWKGGAPGRHFVVDDTRGWFLALGCYVALDRHLGLDGLYRHSDVADVSGRACGDSSCSGHPRSGAFPMKNDLIGVGVFYAF